MKKCFQFFVLLATTMTAVTLISCKKDKANVSSSATKNFSGSLIGEWKFVYRSGPLNNGQYEDGKNVNNGVVGENRNAGGGGKDGGDSTIVTIEFKNDGTYIAKYLKNGNYHWKSAQAENDSGTLFKGNYDLENNKAEKGGMLTLENAGVFKLARLDTTEDLKTIKDDGKDEIAWFGNDKEIIDQSGLKGSSETIELIGKIILLESGYIKVEKERKTLAQGLEDAATGVGITDNVKDLKVGSGDTAYIGLAGAENNAKNKIAEAVQEAINKTTNNQGQKVLAGLLNTDQTQQFKTGLENLERAALSQKDAKTGWQLMRDSLVKAASAGGGNPLPAVASALMTREQKIGTQFSAAFYSNYPLREALAKAVSELQAERVNQENEKEKKAQQAKSPKDAGAVNKFCRYSQQLAFARKKAAAQNTENITKGEKYFIYQANKNELILHATDKDYFTFDTSSKRYDKGVELRFQRVK